MSSSNHQTTSPTSSHPRPQQPSDGQQFENSSTRAWEGEGGVKRSVSKNEQKWWDWSVASRFCCSSFIEKHLKPNDCSFTICKRLPEWFSIGPSPGATNDKDRTLLPEQVERLWQMNFENVDDDIRTNGLWLQHTHTYNKHTTKKSAFNNSKPTQFGAGGGAWGGGFRWGVGGGGVLGYHSKRTLPCVT